MVGALNRLEQLERRRIGRCWLECRRIGWSVESVGALVEAVGALNRLERLERRRIGWSVGWSVGESVGALEEQLEHWLER